MTISDLAAWELITNGTLTADLDTGHITRNGRPTGHYGRDGHCRIKITAHGKRHTITAARIVWMIAHNQPVPTNLWVGHRNGKHWDNRPANLQLCANPATLRHIEDVRRNHDPDIDVECKRPPSGATDEGQPPT